MERLEGRVMITAVGWDFGSGAYWVLLARTLRDELDR